MNTNACYITAFADSVNPYQTVLLEQLAVPEMFLILKNIEEKSQVIRFFVRDEVYGSLEDLLFSFFAYIISGSSCLKG